MTRVLSVAAGVFLGILALIIFFVWMSSGSSRWEVSRSVDPITDRRNVEAHLGSLDHSSTLAVLCSRGRVHIAFAPPVRVSGFRDSEQQSTIVLRFDAGVPKSGGVFLGDRVIGALNDNQNDEWVSSLASASRLAARVRSRLDDRDIDMVFDTRGAGAAIDQVRQACGPRTG